MPSLHTTAANRFLLGNQLPAHVNPRLFILEQLAKTPPEVNPALASSAAVREMKTSGLDGLARDAAEQALVNDPTDFWNPLVEMTRTPETAIWARLYADEINRAPTKESRFAYTYDFWQRTLFANITKRHADLMLAIAFGNELYRTFLGASENVGPNSEKGRGLIPDQNFPREFSEIISAGPFFLDNDGTALDEWSLLFSGLQTEGYNPDFQEPGTRMVKDREFKVDVASDGHIREGIEWISTRPETARYQTLRIGWPLLGGNFTTRLHDHLTATWLATAGDRRAVLTALFDHDDAWIEAPRAPVNTLHGLLAHYRINDIPVPTPRRGKARLAVTYPMLGYLYERAPNAKGGLPLMSYDCANPFFRACRTYWPGTTDQVAAALSIERIIV